VLVIWFVGSVIAFFRGQSRIFAEMHRLSQGRSELDVLAANFPRVLREIQRINVAYAQYVRWATVLGAFLAEPLGRSDANVSTTPALGPGLPHATGLGVAVASADTVASVAADLGARVFTVGWLDEPFAALLAEAPSRLGTAGTALTHDRTLLWSDPGSGPASLLGPWAETLRASGTGAAGAGPLWRRALERLAAPDLAEVRSRLFATVRVTSADGGSSETSAERFRGGLATAGPGSGFDATILVAHQRASAARTVDQVCPGTCGCDPSTTATPPRWSRRPRRWSDSDG
jgi:hypothetical protein